MSTADQHTVSSPSTELLELHNGDHMPQAEFHRIYSTMPEDVKAELIGGIVYMASPLKISHGSNHVVLASVFFAYESATKGTETGNNTTVIMDDESEPQPDLYMRILPECGGQSGTTEDDYVEGAPELIAEIANTSRAIDLHRKRAVYRDAGVREYLVLSLHEQQLRWFDLAQDAELATPADGVIRSLVFPGLWIDSAAVVNRDHRQLMETLERGLAEPSHTDFVKQLATSQST